ncbi:uncharacterized protein B0T15DRAFT_194905 [Chaetomium strumarium]|uniref:GPI anchored serine-threonine rich protein n=1 Tax=Chaetomium strumarium TaxID=1170767 RepID=A0AAJ0GSN5_9PEZI|nr:hypothetical protein B0T15DRAFT_194905 [Chaetomium strumarium]
MKAFLVPLAILASSAVAQTTACAADYIVESCLSTEKAKLESCGHEDYTCRCAGWNAILTCYNNCPNDPRLHDDAGQREIFCGYASQFATTSTKATAKPSTAAAAQTTGADQGASSSSSGSSSTATTTAAGSTSTNSAADLALNAGGILAAVAGVVAAVL